MTNVLAPNPEFEHRPFLREVERTWLPLFPELLDTLRTQARPVEQYYLSSPDEPYSLRLREELDKHGSLQYTATLKDRGTIGDNGLDRLEVETPISADLYEFYKSNDTPRLRKLRASPCRAIAVDFFEDGYIQIESESPAAWIHFTDQNPGIYAEITGDHSADNEWRAHIAYQIEHGGREAPKAAPELSIDGMIKDITESFRARSLTFVRYSGRSGSGKSTIVNEVQELLRAQGIDSVVISTDDYHRGASWLKENNNGIDWTSWDDPIVYDTASMAHDLRQLQSGLQISRRSIDFKTVEPARNGVILPAPVIILEGIYVQSPDLREFPSFHYNIPTPLATCIGRRIARDNRERPQFTPESNLRYILEEAEPMYRRQTDQTVRVDQ